MADNTTLNPGAGGDVISTDDITTINGGAAGAQKIQRVKLSLGPDGTATDFYPGNHHPAANALPMHVTSFATSANVGVNVLGAVVVTGSTGMSPSTAGGLEHARIVSGANTNAMVTKTGAGQVFGWQLYNASANPRFVKLFNKNGPPTVGTDRPNVTIGLPPYGGAAIEFTNGIYYNLGISSCITSGIEDTNTGVVGTNEVHGIILYK